MKRLIAESLDLPDAHAKWLSELEHDERTVATAALSLYFGLVVPKHLTGACYYLAFVLRQFLKQEFALDAAAVVGYACDGTTPLRMSHAWIEFGGKKVDISLTITELPEYQIPGELIVLDRVLWPGVATTAITSMIHSSH